ncbi:MAG: multicopper oxidase domain-containing protein [Gammaproteobacteria bacterium]|nr:multicopper oxidase domain-containing protein [Gammaproteobacteria bacterium]
MLSRYRLWLVLLVLAALAYPPQWYPLPLRLQLSQWFGASAYRGLPAGLESVREQAEVFCPQQNAGWREGQQIEGVTVLPAETCVADNPYAVAAFVRGTNNVSHNTLMQSGLTADAVVKGRDLDGDGDPDEIHIRLEVAELNGSSAESKTPVTQYALAPGITPGLWVFAPKLAGMATENFGSNVARPGLRLPSPALRVEQGDRVTITLENTHYMPHTLHLHGADHGFTTATGQGNDGVPFTSEVPVLPGRARSYELSPRHVGTMFYHCHVQPHVHVMMGLQGLFIVEENRPDNWLQTMNLGAGQVRAPSVAVREQYHREYDLHYLDLDKELGERIQQYNDPRLITKSMHRDYDVTDSTVDYFTLNGRSFPYTFRESLLVVEEDERIKLRVLNGGAKGIALHTHGHKFIVTAQDGADLPAANRAPRDVLWLATSQRAELALHTNNDGLYAYGPGIWPFHDHQYKGITNDGIGPGGNISAIVYAQYLDEEGWPQTQGVSWQSYFTEAYYRKQVPIWESYAPGLFSDPGVDWWLLLRLVALALATGMFVGLVVTSSRR